MSSSDEGRHHALQQIVALARTHGLTASEIGVALAEAPREETK